MTTYHIWARIKLESIINLHIAHGWTADALCYVLPPIKNWWPFCSEQLQRQIIYQNARICKRNWLIPTPSAISIYLNKTMKMTWLHKFFGLFFIPANGLAKSAQQLILTVLPFLPLYFPWYSWQQLFQSDIGGFI